MNTLFQKMRKNRVKLVTAEQRDARRALDAIFRGIDLNIGIARRQLEEQAPTSPEPLHQTTWYKPSTWF